MLDAAGDPGDLGDEGLQGARERAHEFPLGLALGFAGAAPRGGREPRQQRLGRAAAAVAVLSEEAGQALHVEAGGGLGRRIPLDEGERDGAGHVGEDRRRPGPEAVQERGQLIGRGDARGDQLVAPAHQAAQGLDGVGLGPERAQPVALGAQDVGEDAGVARIALGRDGAVARPARLHQVGVDRDDHEAGPHQGVDQQARGALDGDPRLAGLAVPGEALEQRSEALAVVVGPEPVQHRPLGVEHAHGVRAPAPVHADEHAHGLIPPRWRMVPAAGSPGGMLIDRRSGWRPAARLPVARLGLPAAAVPQVSPGPSTGERRWRSRRRLGTSAPKLAARAALAREVAQ